METNKPTSPKKSLRWLWITLLVVLIAVLIWGYSWASYARPPLDEALNALESDPTVLVETDPWLIFTPVNDEPTTGLIFYPGGRVDPRGYATLLRSIAEEGYLVVVPSMPLNMAIFNTNAADEIISYFSGIESWAIAGHSVGGTSAAIYTANNLEQIAGLAIWASYPADSTDLSLVELPVYSIYGELDEGVDQEGIGARKHLLPPDTVYVEISGGDHHQFGTYLVKEGEDRSTTPREIQQEQIIQTTLDLLNQISE
jgi:dienelactone hydrolase